MSILERAADLYQSPLFKKSREYVEKNCDRWFILSAKHGLLPPNAWVPPYDETLSGKSKIDRMRWAYEVEEQLLHEDIRLDDTLVVLAGNDYCDWIPLVPFQSERPMQGLGIGQQLAWLTEQNRGGDEQLRLV